MKTTKLPTIYKEDEWQSYLEDALEEAIRPASIEVQGGKLRTSQLSQMMDKIELINTAQELLGLTYVYKVRDLPNIID